MENFYDFLLLYEGKARELDSICLLAAELERRRYKVKILNTFSYQIKKMKKINVKVVLVPFLYSEKEIYEYVYRICGRVDKIINLRWEQIFSSEDEKNKTYFGYPKGEAKKAIHICWSKYLRDKLIEYGIPPENAIDTGAIQMDFYQDKFTNLILKKDQISKKYGIDKNMTWNFFISSFSYTTLSKRELNRYQKNISNSSMDLRKLSLDSKKIILDWIECRLKKGKNEIWIYRPHPAERIDKILSDLQKKYDNFYVIKELSVRQWIFVSDKIFNWRSTSLSDAYFAHKACNILRPIPIPEKMESSLMNKAVMICDKNSFFERCDCEAAPISNLNIEKYYKKNDMCKATYEKICDICDLYIKDKFEINEKINYDLVLSNTSITQKIKSSFFYFYYIKFLLYLCNNKTNFLLFKNKIQIIKNNIDNIASEREIEIKKDMLKKILDNNIM